MDCVQVFSIFSKATLILQDIDKEAEKLNFVWKPRAGPDPLAGYLMSPAQQKRAETSDMGSVMKKSYWKCHASQVMKRMGKLLKTSDSKQQPGLKIS